MIFLGKAEEKDRKEREKERTAKEKKEEKEKSSYNTSTKNESNIIYRIIGKGRRGTKNLFGLSNAKNRVEENLERQNKAQEKRNRSVDRTKGIIEQVETSAKDIAFFMCFQMNTEAEDKIKGYHAEKNVQLEETGKAALKVSSEKVADHKQKVIDAIASAANVTPPDVGGTPPDDNTTIDEEELKDGDVVEEVTEGQNSGNGNPPENVPISIEITKKEEENWKIQVQKDAMRAAKDVLPTTYKLKKNRATMRNAVSVEEENRQASMIDLTNYLTIYYPKQKDILHKAVAVRGSESTSEKERADSELEALEEAMGNKAEGHAGNMGIAAICLGVPGSAAEFLGFDNLNYNVGEGFVGLSGVGGNIKRGLGAAVGGVGLIGDGMTLANRVDDLVRQVKQGDSPLVVADTALDALGSLTNVASGLNTVISSAFMNTSRGLAIMNGAATGLSVVGGAISTVRGAVQITDGVLTGKSVDKQKEILAKNNVLAKEDEEAVKQLNLLFDQLTRATNSDKIEGSFRAVGGAMQASGQFIPVAGTGLAVVGSIAEGVGSALADKKRELNLETYAEQSVPWEEMEKDASASNEGIKKLSMPDKRRTIFKFAGATYGSSTEAALIATRSIAAGLRDKNNKFEGKKLTLSAMRLEEKASEEMINRRMGMNKKQAENSALALGNELKKEKARYQCKFGLFNWRF